MIRRTRTRRGVTLVEMMVAAAMSILGMWLLAWLYQQGLDNFRGARARADLAAQERMVTTLLTRDLKADHFLDDSSRPNNGRRLSDLRLDQITLGGTQLIPFINGGYTPPRGGYFRAGSPGGPVWNNGSTLYAPEGTDDYSYTTSRSGDHYLAFTVILPGGSSSQVFSAETPAGSGRQYSSTVAEVAYFLKPSGQTAGGVPTFDLYRQQRLAAPSNDYVQAYSLATTVANQADAREVMSLAGVNPNPRMGTLADLTVPPGRIVTSIPPGTTTTSVRNTSGLSIPAAFVQNPITSNRYGEDKLMSNVLSFEVKFTGTASLYAGGLSNTGGPVPLLWPTPFNPTPASLPPNVTGNSDYPYDFLPYDGLFDTHSQQVTVAGTATQPTFSNDWKYDVATLTGQTRMIKAIRITGVQIRIRAFDTGTRTTRQTTMTVDL